MGYEGRPSSEFVDLDIVQSHIGKATDYVADLVANKFRDGTSGALRHMGRQLQFDSPLEVVFWVWWGAAMWLHQEVADSLVLEPQSHVVLPNGSRYRVDFMIEPFEPTVAASPEWMPIAVELDGHEFHERTRDQVALRDRRDRELQQAGWKVFHYSFAEFTNRPVDCIDEVIVYARNQLNRASVNEYIRRRHRADPSAQHQKDGPVGGDAP